MIPILSILISREANNRASLRRRQYLTSMRSQVLRNIPDDVFINTYRLNKQEFVALCDELRRNSSLNDTRISLEMKVLTTLSFYAMGSYQKCIASHCYMNQRSVSRCIKEVTKSLVSSYFVQKYIRFPTTREEKNAVQKGFYEKYGIPGVLGAIDCTHVDIVRPSNPRDEACCFDRKGRHSLNVQMISDCNLRILNCNAKFGGAAHDSYIWNSSIVRPYMENLQRNGESVWLLGDSGYPQRSYLMTPILNAEPGSRNDAYTKRHIKARNCIERTFGVLKSRFRCLLSQRVLYYHPDYAGEIVMACCVLHNILITSRGPPAAVNDANEVDFDHTGNIEIADDGPDLLIGRAVRDRLISRMFQ